MLDKVKANFGVVSISHLTKNVEGHFQWAFSSLYRPQGDEDRSLIWNNLSALKDAWSCMCYIMVTSTLSDFRGKGWGVIT